MRSRTKHALAYATTTAGIASEVFFGLQEKAGQALAAEGLAAALGAPGAGLLLGVLAKAGGSALTSLGINLFSTRIDKSGETDLNHDLAKASGSAIAAVIRSEAPKQAEVRAKRRELEALADEIERRHDPEVLESASGEAPPVNPAELLTDPGGFLKQIALTRAQWEAYLHHVGRDVCERLHLVGTDLGRIAETLEEHYGDALYRQLKASAAGDGKAFAGAVLRLLDTVLVRLDRMHADLASTSEATWKAVLQLRKDLDVGKMTAAIDALRKAAEGHEAVLAGLRATVAGLPARFDSLERQLAELPKRIVHELRSEGFLAEGKRTNIVALGQRSFHGRDDIFRALEQRFSKPDAFALAVLHGPPGVGKSETAREYARRNAARYPGGMLFIEATAGVGPSLAEVGRRVLGLHRPELPLQDQAYSILYRLGEKPTLLILDGVRAPDELDPWLPSANAACHVIATTNHSLWDRDKGPIPHGPLTREAAGAIVDELAPGIDPAQRERVLRHADGVAQQLVPEAKALDRARHRKRDFHPALRNEAKSSYAAPYEQLDEEARLLLHGLAFLRSASIPLDEIEAQVLEPLGTSATLGEVIDRCLDASLLDPTETGVKLHQLVAEYLGGRTLPSSFQGRLGLVRKQQRSRVLELAAQVGTNPADSDCALRLTLFPTDPAAWDGAGIPIGSSQDCHAVGFAHSQLGRFAEALPWFERAVTASERGDVHGRVDHESLGASRHLVGNCHAELGSFSKALPWYELAVAASEQGDVHGRVDYASLGWSLHKVGYCCASFRQFAVALLWYERAVAAKQQGDVHGRVDHTSLGATLHLVGNCHAELGSFTEALPWYERAVAAQQQGDVHGRVDYASLGSILHEVGHCFAELGRFAEALRCSERAFAAQQQGDVHGRVDHASLGASLHQVGYCHSSLGRFSEALPWYERALAASEQGDVHGRVDRESVRIIYLSLAQCLDDLGEPERAAEARERGEDPA